MDGLVVFAIILLIIAIFLIRCVCIVPQANAWVIECLGRYSATWNAGLNFKIPFLYKIVKKVSLKEQVADFEPQPVITKDNVTMMVDSVVFFSVFDAKLFTYGVERPIAAIENLSATTLRNIIGSMTLDETLTSRDSINGQITSILDEATDKWGIKVNRVELKNIIPPREIQDAMEKQMKAEREKRQTLLEADAHKQSSITRAEGDKQAMILKAEAERDSAIARATGKAESIRLVYEAEAKGIEMLKNAAMDEKVLMLKKLDALKEVGNGRATKIVVPTDLASAASDLTFKTEMLGIGNALGVDSTALKTAAAAKNDVCCDDDEKSAVTKHFATDHDDAE